MHHVFDHCSIGFAFGFEHFEDFKVKQSLKLAGIRRPADPKGTIVLNAAIGGENMQMGVKILKINNSIGENH